MATRMTMGGVEMDCKTAEDVKKIVKERDISFIQFWFTDVLGFLKSFAVTPSELEEGLTEGMGFDGSSIEGFARIEESDMIAKPDPDNLPAGPLERRGSAGGPDVLRHPESGRNALRGGSPLRVQEAAGQGRRERLHLLHRAGAGVFLFQGQQVHGSPGLRAGTSTRGPWTWRSDLRRETIFALAVHGHSGGVQPSRGGPQPA